MKNFTMAAICLVSLLLAGLIPGVALGATYQINWCSINAGGGALSNSAISMNCSVGQAAAGYAGSTSVLNCIGYWAAYLPVPTVVSTLATAKLLGNQTYVSAGGMIATTDYPDLDSLCFYVEAADRSSGIRVSLPPGSVPGLARGSVVNVIGTMGSLPSGERDIEGPMVIIVGSPTTLKPLGMNNGWVGGGNLGVPPLGEPGVTGGVGLNNVGLLISTWGRVSYDSTGLMMYVDDGSGYPVIVDYGGITVLPPAGQYANVVGISTLYESGTSALRMIWPRNYSDIMW